MWLKTVAREIFVGFRNAVFGIYVSRIREVKITMKLCLGYAVAQLIEALRYKSGQGFDFRWCHFHNPSGRTMALGSTQPLTEMSTRNIS